MTAFPIYALNDFVKSLQGLKQRVAGKSVPFPTANITGFIAAGDGPEVTTIDPTLSIALTAIDLKGNYDYEIPGALLTPELMGPVFDPFGNAPFVDTFPGPDSDGAPDPFVQQGDLGDGIWGVISNALYLEAPDTDGFNTVTVSWGSHDVQLGVRAKVASGGWAVVLRLVDSLNYYKATVTSIALTLHRIVAGVSTVVDSTFYAIADGDSAVATCRGSTITVSITRATVVIATVTYAKAPIDLTAASHGLNTNSTFVRFDEFSLTAATPPTPYLILEDAANNFRVAQELVYMGVRQADVKA